MYELKTSTVPIYIFHPAPSLFAYSTSINDISYPEPIFPLPHKPPSSLTKPYYLVFPKSHYNNKLPALLPKNLFNFKNASVKDAIS